MKKNIAFLCFFILISFFASSQNKVKSDGSTSGLYNKWSAEMSLGQSKGIKPYNAGYFSSNPSKRFNINGLQHFDLGVRYMFNNYFGAKLDFGYDLINNNEKSNSLSFESNQYRVGLQGVSNLGRLLKFETFTNRFNLLAHAGIQLSQLSVKEGANNGLKEYNGGVILGLTPQFKITNRFSLTADFSYLYNFRQHLNWDGSFSDPSNNLSGSLMNTSIGLNFYIGDKNIHADWYAEDFSKSLNFEQYNDKELKDRIEFLEKKSIDTDNDGVPDYIDEQNDTPKGLKVDSKGKIIDINLNGKPDEIEGLSDSNSNLSSILLNNDAEYLAIIEFEYNIMYYELSRVDPNKESRKKLKFIVDFLLKHPDINIKLDGYTDNLGKVQSNVDLSKRRAAKLKIILISFNIDPSRIFIEGNGVDTIFSDSSLGEPLARRVSMSFFKS